jgi:hypothetical protein
LKIFSSKMSGLYYWTFYRRTVWWLFQLSVVGYNWMPWEDEGRKNSMRWNLTYQVFDQIPLIISMLSFYIPHHYHHQYYYSHSYYYIFIIFIIITIIIIINFLYLRFFISMLSNCILFSSYPNLFEIKRLLLLLLYHSAYIMANWLNFCYLRLNVYSSQKKVLFKCSQIF